MGDFVAHRRLRAGLAGPDREGDLAQDEVHRCIHEFKDRPLVDLVGRYRLCHLGAVEVGALDLGGDQEPLRLFAEEEDRRVRHPSVVEQVQVLKQVIGRCIGSEGEPAGRPGCADEPRHPLRIQVFERCLCARSRIEGAGADQLLLHQVLDERRIQPGDQFCGSVEPFPDQPGLCSADERTHLRVAGGAVPDVDEPLLPFGGGEVELSPGRRDHTGILRAAVVSEQPT